MSHTWVPQDTVRRVVQVKDVRKGDFIDTRNVVGSWVTDRGVDYVPTDAQISNSMAVINREGKHALFCYQTRFVHVWRPVSTKQPQRCCPPFHLKTSRACRPTLCCRCVDDTADRCDACCPPRYQTVIQSQINYIQRLEELRDKLQSSLIHEEIRRLRAERLLSDIRRTLGH